MKKRVTDTSIECYYSTDRTPNREAVLKLLGDGEPRSARRCANDLGMPERNNAHPRLNELEHDGFVVKLPDKIRECKRPVYAYQITAKGLDRLCILEERKCQTESYKKASAPAKH